MKVTRHDDVIKWKHFPRNWPFVRGIHRSPVNSPHKGQWRGTLMFSLISARINAWVNNGEAGDLRRNRAHCDVIVRKRICQLEYISSIIDTIRALPYFVVVINRSTYQTLFPGVKTRDHQFMSGMFNWYYNIIPSNALRDFIKYPSRQQYVISIVHPCSKVIGVLYTLAQR